MCEQEYRIEHDSLGEVKVPKDALYAAQTQRAVDNFPISPLCFPRQFIRAIGLIKGAAAAVNLDLGQINAEMAAAIQSASAEVAHGAHDAHFAPRRPRCPFPARHLPDRFRYQYKHERK